MRRHRDAFAVAAAAFAVTALAMVAWPALPLVP
ncbi:hypothetical protein GGR88_002076 [Sphingomonas jejuensis]|uniref:Uncharacterized protein n=1 Tax=Sphingomonas jejuensis TaxID=904715 RepID=A0ABX0XPA8_9SPHN|nr:hypothetical protein [Sphingomonas jejuensis]